MTPLRLTAAVATLLPLLISPLAASDEDGNYTSVGLGGQSCKRFVSTLSDRTRSGADGKLFRTWIAGHVSGLNTWVVGARNFLEPLTLDQAIGALRGWCNGNPKASLDEAVTELELRLLSAHGVFPSHSVLNNTRVSAPSPE